MIVSAVTYVYVWAYNNDVHIMGLISNILYTDFILFDYKQTQ